MVFGECRSVHVRGDECVGVQRFLDRYAANEGRNFAGDLVEAAKHDMFAGGLHSGALQHVAQARTGESCRTHRALAPLDAGNLRAVQTAAIAGTLKRIYDGVDLKFGKLGEAHRQRLV